MKQKTTILFMSVIFFLTSWSSVHADKINTIHVTTWTHTDFASGTDNDVHIVLLLGDERKLEEYRCNLDTPGPNFERSQVDEFDCPAIPAYEICNIKQIQIQKSPDDMYGGWRLSGLDININGKDFYANPYIFYWLENDSGWSVWQADFQPQMCPPPIIPAEALAQSSTPFDPCEIIEYWPEFQEHRYPDADCDKIKDKDDDGNVTDPVWSPLDTDGDCVYDEIEKVVGTDKNNPDTDGDGIIDCYDLPDEDNDCLADYFENRMGTIVGNPDTDGDGWLDGGCNMRTTLFLTAIEARNIQEDIELGRDELFLTFNHMRMPPANNLEGYWRLEDESSQPVAMPPVAVRTRGANPVSSYYLRMDVREQDLFDWSLDIGVATIGNDNFVLDYDRQFPENGSFSIDYQHSGLINKVHYVFHFVAIGSWFFDPSPLDKDADKDHDGLSEEVEHEINSMTSPQGIGLSDPEAPDIFMELDWAGSDQQPERYTKEDIVSRFSYRGYRFHLDDGVFGGGQHIATNDECFDLDKARQYRNTYSDPRRINRFHYALAVDEVSSESSGGSCDWTSNLFKFGWGETVRKDVVGRSICSSSQPSELCSNGGIFVFVSDFLDHVSDLESIVWLHEFGHNLGLCHLPGEDNPPAVLDNPMAQCTFCGENCPCTHYWPDGGDWSPSAMGTSANPVKALLREIDYSSSEWQVIDLSSINNRCQ